MALIRCPECGREISDTAINCPHCGYSFEKMKFCKFCGEKIPADSEICTKCGRRVENSNGNSSGITINNVANATASTTTDFQINIPYGSPKKKMVALLLCIFLGPLGAHKFYEGNILMGIIYIFTAGLFFVGWIIDIIRLLGKPSIYYV